MTSPHWPDSNLVALKGLAERLGIQWIDLVAVMANESGCLPDPPHRGPARGLIQFEPDTLEGLGWKGRPDAFAMKEVAQQLEYVEAYYRPYARAGLLRPGLGALYTATFLPALLGHAGDRGFVLCGVNGPYAWAYAGNKGFDRTKKGTITVQDLIDAAERALNDTPLAQEIVTRLHAIEDMSAPALAVDVTDGGEDEPLFTSPAPANDTDPGKETG